MTALETTPMAGSKTRSRNRPARSSTRSPARSSPPKAQAQPGQAQPGQAQPGQAQPGQVQPSRAKRQPVEVAPEPVRPGMPPPWLQVVTLVLALGGLGVSIYETWAHYNGSRLFACNGNGAENCTAVITSPQSMVFGVIPVAILGLAFYVFVVAIMSPWAWRMQRREVHLLRLASLTVGMGFVMYLIYAELYQIGSWCLYCTVVHIITFLLFCITVVSAAIWGIPAPKKAL
jgi:uncharacterized membrane protein